MPDEFAARGLDTRIIQCSLAAEPSPRHHSRHALPDGAVRGGQDDPRRPRRDLRRRARSAASTRRRTGAGRGSNSAPTTAGRCTSRAASRTATRRSPTTPTCSTSCRRRTRPRTSAACGGTIPRSPSTGRSAPPTVISARDAPTPTTGGAGGSTGGDVNNGAMARREGETLIADNRKAGHDYHLLESFEAGVALTAPRSRRSAKAA